MAIAINNFSNYSITENGIITNIKTMCIKKHWLGKNGYYYVDLQQNGIKQKIAIHRLLAIHFIPNSSNREQVNHIDGNKLNNQLSNLEWVTRSENTLHAYQLDLMDNPRKINKDTAINLFMEKIVTNNSTVAKLAKELNTGITQLSYRMKEAANSLNCSYWYSLPYTIRKTIPMFFNDYPITGVESSDSKHIVS